MDGGRYSSPFIGRSARVLDIALVLWVALWIGFAVAIAIDVHNLSSLSDTLSSSGRALGETGRALRQLDNVPFVGSRVGPIARRIEEVAASAQASGDESRSSVERLSVLLGIAVALIPTIPILGLYLPLRRSATKDVRAVRRSLSRQQGDPLFDEFLARRAAQTLPFHVLQTVSQNPWRDIAEGRTGPLADLELRRLGLRRPGGSGGLFGRRRARANS
jgi:hypothetical protein